MAAARLNRDARLAILHGFERRDVSGKEVWEEFAEREGYGRPVSILNRIEADFGPKVSIEVGDALAKEVMGFATRQPFSHPVRAAEIAKRAVEETPEKIVPMVLPDELFGRLIEVAWEMYKAADLDASIKLWDRFMRVPQAQLGSTRSSRSKTRPVAWWMELSSGLTMISPESSP